MEDTISTQTTTADEDLEAKGLANSKRPVRDVLRNLVLGLLALAVAAAGALVPMLPGWVFGFVGLLLLGSAIPPVRRALSRLVVRSGKVIDRCVSHPQTHRMLVRTLRRPSIRSSLEPAARWAIVNRAAQQSAATDDDDQVVAES